MWRNHTIKGGFFFEYSGENDNDQINVATVPGGSQQPERHLRLYRPANWIGGTSGVGLANLALGLADTYTEIGPKSYTAWRGQMYRGVHSGCVAGHPQAAPRLWLPHNLHRSLVPVVGQLGLLRPRLLQSWAAPQVNPTTGNVTLGTGNPYNGMVIPGISKFPSSALQGNRVPAANPANNACAGQPCTGLFAPQFSKGYVQTTHQFQPRLGIAYQLDPKTVVRAAGGEFVTRMGLLDNIFPGGNSPFQPYVTVSNVSVDNPGASLTRTSTPHSRSPPWPRTLHPRPGGTGTSPSSASFH